MARIRSIKPEFFRHSDLYEAERETGLPLRLAFAGLWTAADREGRFKWKARELKLDCLPHDDVDFAGVLDALVTRGWVVRYAVDGVEYGCIPTWKAHQVINNREKASELPEPTEETAISTRQPRVIDASTTRLVHTQGEGKGKEGKGREIDAAIAAPPESEEKQVYELGKKLFGDNSGGFVKKLIVAKGESLPLAHAALLTAKTKTNPKEYIGAIIRSRDGTSDNGRSF